jgi:multiple sugar transport system substrate-binding protein
MLLLLLFACFGRMMDMNRRFNRRTALQVGGGAALGAAVIGAPRSTSAQKTVVSYGTPGNELEDASWAPVFEAFNASHDDIEARYTPLGGNYGPEYLQNLQARIAAGNAPDVFFILDGYVAGFAERNVIIPIDDYVQSSGLDLNEYYTAHVDGLRYGDQLWGLPRNGAPNAMYYNADMFDEAGIAYPDDTWDWAKYLEAATALTQRDDGGRAIQLGGARGEWVNWVWQAGGDIFNEDKTKCLLGAPEAIEGLQFVQDLVLTHKVAASPEDLADQTEQEMFLAGRLATFFSARGVLSAICQTDFRFDAAITPKGKVRMARTNDGPTSVWAGSPNQEAALELMRFLASDEAQRLYMEITGGAFPSWKSLTSEEWFTGYTCGQASGAGINTAFRTEIEEGWVQTWPTHPRWPEIIDAISQEIDSLYLGEKTAEQVGTDAAAAVDALLAG